jgi:hypothetical protein
MESNIRAPSFSDLAIFIEKNIPAAVKRWVEETKS